MDDLEAEQLVAEYFKEKGFMPVKIDEQKTTYKSPDFKVFRNAKLQFICEVKNPKHIFNKDKQVYTWTTMVRKIRNKVHQAKKQFKDYDPKHEHLWVVVFTSTHFQLGWDKMKIAIEGKVKHGDKVTADLNDKPYVTETHRSLKSIDLVMWLQVNPEDKRIYQHDLFINNDSPLLYKSEKITKKLGFNDV